MQAIQFEGTIPRYAFTKLHSLFSSKAYITNFSNVLLKEVDPPALPGPDWVRIRPQYGGICGSDINLILLNDSPYMSPFVSFPFTIGHENCGHITEVGRAVERLIEGMRVIANPLLPCRTRGVELCSQCQQGEEARCINFRSGTISPGLLIGACHDTGGSWSNSFVAHQSQIYVLPEQINWENAVLIDTFASALHPLLRNFPNPNDRVLIVGGGPIGLSLIHALRSLDFSGSVTLLAKYKFQGELGANAGADHVVYLRDSDYRKHLAELLGSQLLKPMMGPKVPLGGPELVFDCVGNSSSIKDALAFAGPGARVVLVGLASFPRGVDWTPIWLKEITLTGAFTYSQEDYKSSKTNTYGVALDLMVENKIDLSPLLTHTFGLADYRKAITANLQKGRNKLIKSAFKIE